MNRSLLVLGLLLIAMIGCSTKPMKVQTDHASGFPFSTLKTYGFVAQGPSNAETDAARKTAERLRLDDLVQGHVRHQLAAKGYQEAPQAPDFRIAWAFGEWPLDNHKQANGGGGAVRGGGRGRGVGGGREDRVFGLPGRLAGGRSIITRSPMAAGAPST